MLISKTSQYAIQSLIYLATQEPGMPVLSRQVAQKLRVPGPYLAKIMQLLCRGGLLNSYRGRLGGFCLCEEPSSINLMRILLITEGPEFSKSCLLGLKACADETACPMHLRWKPIKQEILDMLSQQTLDVLSDAVKGGKYRICDIPYALMPAMDAGPA